MPAKVRRFGRLRFREAVLLELPLGRAPPQGGLLEAVTTVRLPKPAKKLGAGAPNAAARTSVLVIS